MEGKKEIQPKTENSVTPETTERLCDVRCKICNSNHLQAFHDIKSTGKTNVEARDAINEKFGVRFSTASMSRHLKNYNKKKEVATAEIINAAVIEDATKQAEHTRLIVALIDKVLTHLETQGKTFDVADLDKLMKLRYQVLSGEDANDNDIMGIFQRASNKYGLNLEQGILLKSPLTGHRADEEDIREVELNPRAEPASA